MESNSNFTVLNKNQQLQGDKYFQSWCESTDSNKEHLYDQLPLASLLFNASEMYIVGREENGAVGSINDVKFIKAAEMLGDVKKSIVWDYFEYAIDNASDEVVVGTWTEKELYKLKAQNLHDMCKQYLKEKEKQNDIGK